MLGKLKDLTEWMQRCTPGEEKRAKTAVAAMREYGMLTTGGRGPWAPHMRSHDYAAAICAVLHPGEATKAHEKVKAVWDLPLRVMALHDDDHGRPLEREPLDLPAEQQRPFLAPWFPDPHTLANGFDDKWNALGVLHALLDAFPGYGTFDARDRIELEVVGERVALTIKLHQSDHGVREDGYRGDGAWSRALELLFHGEPLTDRRSIRTTRVLGAKALNELIAMTPARDRGIEHLVRSSLETPVAKTIGIEKVVSNALLSVESRFGDLSEGDRRQLVADVLARGTKGGADG